MITEYWVVEALRRETTIFQKAKRKSRHSARGVEPQWVVHSAQTECTKERAPSQLEKSNQKTGRLFVPVDLFAAFVTFLCFNRQRCNGTGVQSLQTDGFAGFLTITVGTFGNASQRCIDF